jgi:hypothetical protein
MKPLQRQRKRFRSDERAVSPAISTVIVTSAVIVMVLVAMVYTNGLLNTRLAENEFTTNKQFMLTTALQIDDIAWTIGRTQTVRYSSRYAQVTFEPNVLSYSIEVVSGEEVVPVNQSLQTGVILFNMPTTEYTLGNDYVENIFPAANTSFIQNGPSMPVSKVYVMEKLPMESGNFTRVVIAPTIRQLNSTIGDQTYVKFYLPLLTADTNPMLSQSVTLIGKTVTQYTSDNVARVIFKMSFPRGVEEGFDASFFPFNDNIQFFHYETTVDLPPHSIVEFYIGTVSVSLGRYV